MSHSAWALGMIRMLDEFGIARYGLLGVSGGGPSALALAAVDARRVAAVSLVCTLGPVTEPELARASGAFARWTLERARHHLNALDWLVLRPLAAIGHAIPSAALTFMGLYHSRAELLMLTPWDFALPDVLAPVKLWRGIDDGLLLPEHSRWLARRLPAAELVLVDGAGHFSLPIDHHGAILGDLAERCR